MYDYFQGAVAALSPTQVTIDCQGVGYQLEISLHTYSHLKDRKQAKVFAHLAVREDAHVLFGFTDEDERRMFRELIGVSGVGAGTARVILSSLNAAELQSVIMAGDQTTLQRVKGIGAKTAQRILVDLQDRMKKLAPLSEPVRGLGATQHNTGAQEALSALLTLGFARANAEKAIRQASASMSSDSGVEQLIKAALAYL